MIYTLHHGISVYSDTNLTSPGSIQSCCNYCACKDAIRESPAFYHILLADMLFSRLYKLFSVNNYMTTVIKRLWQRSIGTESSAWLFFCQISSGELSIVSAEGNARIMVVGEKRRHLMMSATCMCLRDSI